MTVKELKNFLDDLPDDAEVEINSIYNEAGECESSPIVKTVYRSENNVLTLTPEQLVFLEDDEFDPDGVVSVKAVDIEWDTDGGDMRALCLSNEMEIPLNIAISDGEIDEEAISDYVSNESGYCHYGFNIEISSTVTEIM